MPRCSRAGPRPSTWLAPRTRAHIWGRHVLDSLRLAAVDPARDGARRSTSAPAPGCRGWCWRIATGIPFASMESDRRKAAFLREAARVTAAPVHGPCRTDRGGWRCPRPRWSRRGRWRRSTRCWPMPRRCWRPADCPVPQGRQCGGGAGASPAALGHAGRGTRRHRPARRRPGHHRIAAGPGWGRPWVARPPPSCRAGPRRAARRGCWPSPTRRAASARPRRPINLATALAAAGEPVLLVDLDPQGNASTGLGIGPDAARARHLRALVGETPPPGSPSPRPSRT